LLSEPEEDVPDLVRDVVRWVVIALGVLVVSVLANEVLRRHRRRRAGSTPPPVTG
jgi:hypothetical protein